MFTYFPKRSAAQFLLERRLESNISWRRKVRCSVSVSDLLSFFNRLVLRWWNGDGRVQPNAHEKLRSYSGEPPSVFVRTGTKFFGWF
ncbi:hypothetical protein NC651_017431 [Populus alba x Populus x berolinensis]|nr:hypothetical protein NC651_017431 [Populus alba x Populus x berolinensis]